MKKQISLTSFFKRNDPHPPCKLTSYKSMENITEDIPPTLTALSQLSIGKNSIFKRSDPAPMCTLISYKSTDNIAEDMLSTSNADAQPSKEKKRKYATVKSDYEATKRNRAFCPH